MITIDVRHRRSDIARFGFHVALHNRRLWWLLLATAAVIFGMNVYKQSGRIMANDPRAIVFTAGAIVLTTAIFTLGLFIFLVGQTVLSALLRNRKGSPASQPHTYSLTEFGLSRRSASSDALLKWGGARSLYKGKKAIYVGTSAYSYFILPRHSFTTDAEYESVWTDLQRLLPDRRA